MLKTICLPLKELAEELGVPYATARNWSAGRTEIPPEYRKELAAFAREHAGRLRQIAEDLEREG